MFQIKLIVILLWYSQKASCREQQLILQDKSDLISQCKNSISAFEDEKPMFFEGAVVPEGDSNKELANFSREIIPMPKEQNPVSSKFKSIIKRGTSSLTKVEVKPKGCSCNQGTTCDPIPRCCPDLCCPITLCPTTYVPGCLPSRGCSGAPVTSSKPSADTRVKSLNSGLEESKKADTKIQTKGSENEGVTISEQRYKEQPEKNKGELCGTVWHELSPSSISEKVAAGTGRKSARQTPGEDVKFVKRETVSTPKVRNVETVVDKENLNQFQLEVLHPKQSVNVYNSNTDSIHPYTQQDKLVHNSHSSEILNTQPL